MPFVVGLTGGIGSGKSAVANVFLRLGAAIVDVDVIAHELTAPNGVAIAAIHAAFGAAFVDARGALDRAAMRRLIFADVHARERLEAILHPMIRQESERRSRAASASYVVLVVPLLVETGTYADRVDRVLVVDCDEALRIARVVSRSGITADEVRRIIAAQATREERLQAADDVIVNDADLPALERKVTELHSNYLTLAGEKHRFC